MTAGVERRVVRSSTISSTSRAQREKGVDVALAVDALQVGLRNQIDIAVLVSGDGDLIPLAKELMKNGVRVLVAYFSYVTETGRKSFANERLLASVNYEVDICSLEHDKEFGALFKALFRQSV